MTYNQIIKINDESRAMRAVAKAVTERDIHALDAIRKQVRFHCPVAGRNDLMNLIAVIRKTILQAELKDLLANYEQRFVDSGHDLTEPTRQQLEDKIKDLRSRITL